MIKDIIIKGAKENNLKNIDLVLPRNNLIVFSGVSGCGKSTLAFDTIFAEGQRRFIESLSSYARMFLGQMQKPNVESIEGLSPAISIDQKTTNNNPRSTVGTVTEIYDYLRLLYARCGDAFCPKCGKKIDKQTAEQITDNILNCEEGTKCIILAPVVRGEKGTFAKLFESLQKKGYVRVEVDGNMYTLDEEINLEKNKKHTISVVIDRIVIKEGIKSRLTEAVENALSLAEGLVIVDYNGEQKIYSDKHACIHCGISLPEIEPRLFSFNNPFGACPKCAGLGFTMRIDKELILKKKHLSINQGGLSLSGWNTESSSMSEMYYKGLSKHYGFSLDTPIEELPEDIIEMLLYGNNGEEIELEYSTNKFSGNYKKSFEGIINNLERRYRETSSEYVKMDIGRYMKESPCDMCEGKRLSKEALAIKVGDINIFEFCEMSVLNSKKFIEETNFNISKRSIAEPIVKEIKARLDFLIDVGLGYLSLNRTASTLSGGESQRIRLATQIGSGLTGVLYILDEPSIGLHQRDNEKLLNTLFKLKDMGNTLIVVEHDEDTIRSADYIVDIGPKAGKHGGQVIAQGKVEDIMKCTESETGNYLSGRKKITYSERKQIGDDFISIKGARQNNLKNVNVDIPVGLFTVVTGVSGSGKSSLINEVLYPYLNNRLNRSNYMEGKVDSITYSGVDKVIEIDQSPIGRTPRSNPATYIGVFTPIRELFASLPEAKERGYKASRFSFNVKGGRCELCEGDGIKKIEMFFLPDVYVPCELCHSKRYNSETLQVEYKGKNIFDVLDMTVEEALKFFENISSIKSKLQTLYDVGLGYIKLGQSSTTLSGGEAQRVKLACELSKKSTGKTVYILDEPTTGLHSYDVDKLLKILKRLKDAGNTVIVIEHNLDVIKCADYVIDLGPEGGDGGGTIVATGTPEEVANNPKSITGKFIKTVL